MRALAWLVVAAAWSCDSGTEPAPRVVVDNPPLPAPKPATQIWKGRYVCAQGPTALVLTLRRDGAALAGTFDFGPLPDNPQVPHGSYTLTGFSTIDNDDNVDLTLVPGAWIERPDRYIMVGIHAKTDRERRVLRGMITDPSCGPVVLARAD